MSNEHDALPNWGHLARPLGCLLIGLWLALMLHKDWILWTAIFGFLILQAVHLVRLIYVFIKFSLDWRREHK